MAHIFYNYESFKYYLVMERIIIPKELKELKLHDGRPAYIFIDAKTGKFPTIGFCCEKSTCPYCGQIVQQETCSCVAYKTVLEYNKSLNR
ncbi:MAG: hypothetical protein IJ019_01610 [Alphaproteobacteria bacterium]|nr:hypothetical protein [Alphaproteobacteria bacterium]